MEVSVDVNIYQIYDGNLDEVVDLGVVKPLGDLCLLRGLTGADVRAMSGGAIFTGFASSDADVRHSVVFEVVATGPDATLEIGHHCLPASAAMEPHKANFKTKFVYVEEKDILSHWDPSKLAEAKGRKVEAMRAAANERLK